MNRLFSAGIGLIIGIITFFIFGINLITKYLPRELFPPASGAVAFIIAMFIWSLPFIIIGALIGSK